MTVPLARWGRQPHGIAVTSERRTETKVHQAPCTKARGSSARRQKRYRGDNIRTQHCRSVERHQIVEATGQEKPTFVRKALESHEVILCLSFPLTLLSLIPCNLALSIGPSLSAALRKALEKAEPQGSLHTFILSIESWTFSLWYFGSRSSHSSLVATGFSDEREPAMW